MATSENRHDRYVSGNAGYVHDGTGDQASSGVTLRQQPVLVPSNRRFFSGCTRQVCFQQRAGRCPKTRGFRWPALEADRTGTFPRHDHQLRFASDDREDVREAQQGEDHHHSAA